MASGQPSDPSGPGPSDGRMQSVFSTLREALRPGDARRLDNNKQQDSSLPAGQPKQRIPLRPVDQSQHDQQQLRDDPNPGDTGSDNRPRAFPEAHRDATGHTSVLESIMPGRQGLSGRPAWDPVNDPNPPPPSERRGSGILGALDSIRSRRRSSATSSREEVGGFTGFRRSSVGSGSGDGNYTYDTFSGTRSSEFASARHRASSAGSNDLAPFGGSGGGQPEAMRAAANTLPGSVAGESQVGR
ncbi:hypothetical protein Micbo1qcDRAFT_199131 [Microdochium bolleyi]|uniref:Uncharacterized protein n=1 Tax=Microdochium bolleyi TaxID=196109 RepID=A0A136JGM4_9PEZI|nr:hypothetical protein Micbo1qcDRAFT_199131 [Microdochium bolleyi]